MENSGAAIGIFDENIFKEFTQIYQEALKNQKSINNKNPETKQRKRKINWFNPPYSKNISTKVGSQFLKLINKRFSLTPEILQAVQ